MLPCNLSWMACFADINVSQGSVATCARCSGIFNMHLTANLPRNLSVKNFLKSVRNWQNYGHESVAPFFGLLCTCFRQMPTALWIPMTAIHIVWHGKQFDKSIGRSSRFVWICAHCCGSLLVTSSQHRLTETSSKVCHGFEWQKHW